MKMVIQVLLIATCMGAATSCPASALEKNADRTSLRQGIPFDLQDQYGKQHAFTFPRDHISVLVFADRQGSDQLEKWVRPLYERYVDTLDIRGVAQLRGVPTLMKPLVRALFRQGVSYPVMLDWTGAVSAQYDYEARKANVLILGPDGTILHRVNGEASRNRLVQCFSRIDRYLQIGGEVPN